MKENRVFSSYPLPSSAGNKTDKKKCHILASPALSPEAVHPHRGSPAVHLIIHPSFSLLRQINLL